MSEAPIHADPEVLEGIKREFRERRTTLDNLREPLRTRANEVQTAAGQFGTDLADGLTAFHLSWGEVLEVLSGDSGTIATNVGQYHLDLSGLDDRNG